MSTYDYNWGCWPQCGSGQEADCSFTTVKDGVVINTGTFLLPSNCTFDTTRDKVISFNPYNPATDTVYVYGSLYHTPPPPPPVNNAIITTFDVAPSNNPTYPESAGYGQIMLVGTGIGNVVISKNGNISGTEKFTTATWSKVDYFLWGKGTWTITAKDSTANIITKIVIISGTVPPPPTGCPVLNIPTLTLHVTSGAPGATINFTSTASGGQTTGIAYIYEINLGTTVVHTSATGQGPNYTGSFKVPSITAGAYNAILTVKDSCVPQQARISTPVSFTVTGTTPPVQGYNCGACNTPVTGGTYPNTSACNTGCVTPPPVGTKWDCTDGCSFAHETGKYNDQASCLTGCTSQPPPTTLCPTGKINIPGLGCQDKNMMYMIGAGIGLILLTRK